MEAISPAFSSSRSITLRKGGRERTSLRAEGKFTVSKSPFDVSKLQKSIEPKNVGLSCRRPNALKVRANAAASAAGSASDDVPIAVPEAKKFLGQDVKTLKKVIPLGLMFFCILYNYTILRDTKDVLVVTAPGSGAEIIPFLKTWVNLPMAIGFMIIYSKMANVLSTQALFYACILPFIAFFGSFAFVLYPLRTILHPTELATNLLNILGPRFMGPLSILRNWSFCLFYVMAELWGSVVVSVLFWGFANQVKKNYISFDYVPDTYS